MDETVEQGLAQEANNPSETESTEIDWLNFDHSVEETTEEDTESLPDNAIPTEQPVQQQPVDNDIVRSQYWQSQHDRLRNEIEPWQPVIELIKEKPELLDLIKEKVNPQPEPGPQIPDKPVKPSNFNWDDAISNPDSDSYKFREAQEAYNDNLSNYLITKEQMREKAYQEQVQQQQAIVQQRQQYEQVNNLLTTRYGMESSEALEFIQEMSDPKNITFENLIDLHKLKKQRQMPKVNVQQKPYTPIPGGMVPNTGQQTMNPDQMFMRMLKGKM